MAALTYGNRTNSNVHGDHPYGSINGGTAAADGSTGGVAHFTLRMMPR